MVHLRIRHSHLRTFRIALNRVGQPGASQFLGDYIEHIQWLLDLNYDSTPVIGCWHCGHLDHKFPNCDHRPSLSMEEKFWFRGFGVMTSIELPQTLKDNFFIQLQDNIHLDHLTAILKRHIEQGEHLGNVLDVIEPQLTLQNIIYRRPQPRGPTYPCFYGDCNKFKSHAGYILHLENSHWWLVSDMGNGVGAKQMVHFKEYCMDKNPGRSHIIDIFKVFGRNFAFCFDNNAEYLHFYIISLFARRSNGPNFNYKVSIVNRAASLPKTLVMSSFTGDVYPIGTRSHNNEKGSFEVPKVYYSNPLDLEDTVLRFEIIPIMQQ